MAADIQMTKKILFTGYAPIHFLCFLPLYEKLSRLPGIQIFVSGGLRTKEDGKGYDFDAQALYRPFHLPPDQILSVEEVQGREFDLLFSAHTNLILPKRADKVIQIFHGISFRNKSIRVDNMGCDYYFVIGPYMHRRFTEAGLFQEDDNRAVPVGFMKTDRLLDGELDRAQILERLGFQGNRPVVLYAPTGAKNNSLEIMGEEIIRRLAATGRYDILIKLHDHPKNKDIDWFARLEPWTSQHCQVVRELNVIPLMYVADLLVSDASSVSNEYALLNRPMVFLNTPDLLDKERESGNSMLDLDTWGQKGGALVKEPKEIEEAIDFNLRNPKIYSDVRRAMVKDLFYNPGTATEAAVAWLKEHVL